MDARKLMPLSIAPGAGHGSAIRPLARPALRRLILPLLAATALAAIGGAVVGRLASDSTDLPARPAAPAEPGLFDFPSARQPAPPVTEPAAAATPLATAPTAPSAARVPLPVRPPARPAGVERFDSCLPSCDSRDPARSLSATTPPAPAARPGVPLPPRPVGEADATPAAPGLIDQTVTLTRDAVSGLASQAGQWADQVKAVFVPN